jgi:hypothetical protein
MIDPRTVRQRLIDDVTVSAIVGTNITWGPPQASLNAPAVWFSVVSFTRESTFTGAFPYNRTLIDIHLVSTSASEHKSLIDAVISAYDHAEYTAHSTEVKQALIQGLVDSDWDEDTDEYHSILTIQFTT